MVEGGKHDAPTHAVTFVWNGHEVTNQSIIVPLQFLAFTFFKKNLKED